MAEDQPGTADDVREDAIPGASAPSSSPPQPSAGWRLPLRRRYPGAPRPCEYLVVPEGGFRFARPDREHRCVAVRPADPVPGERQRRLCLTPDHRSCPAYQAATARRALLLAEAGLSPLALEGRRSRPIVRTAPLILGDARTSDATAESPHSTMVAGPGATATRPSAGEAGGPDVMMDRWVDGVAPAAPTAELAAQAPVHDEIVDLAGAGSGRGVGPEAPGAMADGEAAPAESTGANSAGSVAPADASAGPGPAEAEPPAAPEWPGRPPDTDGSVFARAASRRRAPEPSARPAAIRSATSPRSLRAGEHAPRRSRTGGLGAMAIGLLVVLAAAAFIVARLPGSPAPGATAPGVAASASPGGSPAASAAATPSPPPSPPATPAPSPVASRTPSPAAATQPPTAVPSAVTRTYRVQAGDTLIAIAARFGVSVEELQQLNGVKDPRLLRVGQVLRIP